MRPPEVFVSYAHDSDEHHAHVRRFATFLRQGMGIDVHLDQWADGVRRDWSEWATERVLGADAVLVIASRALVERTRSTAPQDVGRGSRFEAALLRDDLTRDRLRATARILPVVLPGATVEDIPPFLNPYSTTHYVITEFTEAAVSGLVAALTGVPQHPAPPLGVWRGARQGVAWDGGTVQPVRLSGREHAAAVVMGAGSVRTTVLPGWRRLDGLVGVPDHAVQRHRVGTVRVRLDGEVLLEGRVAWGSPVRVGVDLRVGGLLSLEADRGGADWEVAWAVTVD